MAYVEIPKDLGKIKTKVVFNLTLRQIIGFGFAAVFAIPSYLISKTIVGNDIGILILIIISFPFFFVTFYEKDGLKCEDYIKYIYLHKFHHPNIRVSNKEYKKQKIQEELNANRENK